MSEKYNSLFSIVVTAKMGHALQTRARGFVQTTFGAFGGINLLLLQILLQM